MMVTSFVHNYRQDISLYRVANQVTAIQVFNLEKLAIG